MRRRLVFAVFLALVLAVFGAAHYYLYDRFVAWLTPNGGARTALQAGLAVLTVAPIAARVMERRARPLYRPAWWLASLWMGLGFYLLMAFGVGHLVQAAMQLSGAWTGPGTMAWLVGAPTALALALAGAGLASASRLPGITNLQVQIPRLPAEAEGMKIVQLSDLHIGAIVGPQRVARIVDQVNALAPDLVVITGDLVDEQPSQLQRFEAVLAGLRPRLGTFAVTGNHEFYAGVDAAMGLMKRAGMHVLGNAWVEPVPGLVLFGLHDPSAAAMAPERWAAGQREATQALAEVARDRATILLLHQPVGAEQFAQLGVDLMLSGHTHGGQLWPFTLLVASSYPRVAGLYRVGGLTLYVSRGTGTWGPPMRVGAPAEIVAITLRSATSAT